MAWTDEIADTQAELVYFLRIEGYPVWIFTRTPDSTWTPPSNVTFRDGLGVPDNLSQSIQMFEGTSTVSPLMFRLKDIATTPGATIGTSNPYWFTQAFATGRVLSEAGRYAAYLDEDVDETETVIDVTTATNMPGAAFDLYVGIETMRVTAGFGTTTLTVTRAQYPVVDGAGLGMRHSEAIDDSGNPMALVSDVPFSWYNRRVALYATWYDRASGTFGGRTAAGTPTGGGVNYQLIWPGRLHRLDFDTPTDEWKLECKPLLDDLKRPVMWNAATSFLSSGIQLTGLSVSERSLHVTAVWGDTAGGALPDDARYSPLTIAEGFYSLPALYTAIQEALASWTWTLGFGMQGTRFTVHNPLDPFIGVVGIRLPPVLSVFLGYTDEYVSTTITIVAPPLSTTVGPEPAFPLAALVLPAAATEIPTDTTTGFVTGAPARQETGVAPALLIDGKMVRRYNGTTATAFTSAFRADWPSNTNLAIGENVIVRRSGNLSLVPISQVYAMPRTFGGDTSHGVLRNLLALMTSTGLATNGAYDLLPSGYGLGIPEELIDIASFEAIDDLLGAGLTERQWIVATPTPLIDLLLAEAKTLGFYLVMNGSGQIACRLIGQSLADAADVALTEDNKAQPTDSKKPDRATFSVSPAGLLNQMNFRFNYQWGTDDYTEHPANFRVSQEQYETTRGIDVENRGLFAFETTDLAEIEGGLLARMGIYANPWPTITRSIGRQVFTRLIPGDRATLTDSALPDVFTGQRGVSARSCTVIGVDYDMHKGTGRVTLIHDGILPAGSPLAPAMRVTAFDAGTNIATVAANEFSVAPSTDAAAFAVGDVVLAVEGSAASPAAPTNTERTITNIAGNDITLSGGIGGLNPATSVVYLTFTDWNSVAAAQLTRGTFAANPSNNLIQGAGSARRYL